MSVVVVGVSHRMASVALLERVALDSERLQKLLIDTRSRAHLSEAVVVATCNRIEVYAEADRFHGGIEDMTDLLATHTGVAAGELTPHLFARYEQGAIAHLFGLACGLDSMVVGETQILGQVKAALRTAQELGTAGTVLNGLFQRALHVGKRAHSETALGQAGRSLVGAALQEVIAGSEASGTEDATGELGPLTARRALVVGAGSMASLAATVLRRDHGVDVLIANRTPERGARLARDLDARAVEMDAIDDLLCEVDLVVSCTGANQLVLTYDRVRRAGVRPQARPLAIVDLAMPRDVDDAVGELPGVRLINLDGLSVRLGDQPAESDASDRNDADRDGSDGSDGSDREVADLDVVRSIVASEVEAYVRQRQASAAAPAVVALRSMAAEVVGAELQRLSGRLSGLDESAYAEVEKTVRRVVDKLLHVPTVRVKELGERPVQTSYADALRELFALEPSTAALLESLEEPPRGSESQESSGQQSLDMSEGPSGGMPEGLLDEGVAELRPDRPPSDSTDSIDGIEGTQPHDGKW